MIETLDRLSELPDSLIFSIFGLLPMRDVVATSILAKRWRHLWTTTPYLIFDDTLNAHAKFITPTLMSWRGTKILKMNIDSHYSKKIYSSRDVDLWLRFAKDYEVEELYLYLRDVYSGNDEYCVPQSLFSSCPSLKVLSLDFYKLHINRNVQWKQLTSLTICTKVGLRSDDINRVLDGSPQLEVLVLRFRDTDDNLTIRSTSLSLKKLFIDKFVGYSDTPHMSTRLTICIPNLETFEMKNAPYVFWSLDNVSSLTKVSLLFDDFDNEYVTDSDFVDNLFEEALKHLHPAIQHVENVTLSYFYIKALVALIKKHLVQRLWEAKFLKLTYDDHEEIVDILEFFPKVKMLVLKDISNGDTDDVESNSKFPPSFPNLMRVEVTWCQCDYSIFPLIEILLKYAGNLETMVFRVYGTPSESLLVASQKLLRMQRASSTAKLIFCEDL